MSDLNISDVVPKLRVKPAHSTPLNANNFALIWILVAFKGNINAVSLFCGVGPLRVRGEELPEQLKDGIQKKKKKSHFWELPLKTFYIKDEQKRGSACSTSTEELVSDVWKGKQSEILCKAYFDVELFRV